MRSIFLALLLIIPALSFADSLQLSGDVPTQRTDGSVLAPSEIDGYVIKNWQNGDKMLDIIIDGGLTVETTLPDIQSGSYIFSIATISQGQTGPDSDPISVTMGMAPISPPSSPGIRANLQCATDPATGVTKCSLEVK